jgi:Formate/nitrite family of transporters
VGRMKTGIELVEYSNQVSEAKANSSALRLIILGILAGAYIAFAAEASTMAAYNLLADSATYGLGRALSGVVFAGGLIFCVIAGAELFTGNTLMAAQYL